MKKPTWHNANSAEIEQSYFHIISPLPSSLSSSLTGTKPKDGPISENVFVYLQLILFILFKFNNSQSIVKRTINSSSLDDYSTSKSCHPSSKLEGSLSYRIAKQGATETKNENLLTILPENGKHKLTLKHKDRPQHQIDHLMSP